MPIAFGLIAIGGIFAYSGLTGRSVIDVLRGLPAGVAHTSVWSLPVAYNAINAQASGGVAASKSGGKSPTVSAGKQPAGLGTFDGLKVALWIIPYLAWARKHGWKGKVTSGYRSTADQARVCATGVRPCAAPGTSNHQGTAFPSGAVDVTDAPTLARVLQKFPGPKLLQYAGSQDPVHFSHPHNGSY